MSEKLLPPDLSAWIEKYGSYTAIDWAKWHAANAEYQQARRDQLLLELGKTGQVSKRRAAR